VYDDRVGKNERLDTKSYVFKRVPLANFENNIYIYIRLESFSNRTSISPRNPPKLEKKFRSLPFKPRDLRYSKSQPSISRNNRRSRLHKPFLYIYIYFPL